MKERIGREAQIASARAATPLSLEVIQKGQNHWRVQILQGKRGRCSSRALLSVTQQQFERVSVTGNRVCARTALRNQAAPKEVL
jgi:hypothetical protein